MFIKNRQIIIECYDEMLDLNLSITTVPIITKTRKLKTIYSLEEPQPIMYAYDRK